MAFGRLMPSFLLLTALFLGSGCWLSEGTSTGGGDTLPDATDGGIDPDAG